MENKMQVIGELKQNPYLLKTLSKEYLADKDIIKAALVRKWYEYIEDVDEMSNVANTFDILELFKCADAQLRYNKDFVKELMVSCSGFLFEFLPAALRNDEKIMFFAFKNSEPEYVYKRVLKDAQPDGEDWDSDGIGGYEWDIIEAIRNKSIAKFAGEILLNNKSIAIKILEIDAREFQFFSDVLRDDYDLAMEAVCADEFNFYDISERLQNHPDFSDYII